MKRLTRLMLFSSVLIFGCDDKKIEREYYEKGILKEEVTIKAGKRHGVSVEYYEDGKMKSRIEYSCGVRHGKSQRYYPDGRLAEEFYFRNDKYFGVNKFYRQDGKLEIREYDSLGRVIDRINYLQDGRIDYEQTMPVFLANRDTFLLGEVVTFRARLVNADPWIYNEGQLLHTSGFKETGAPKDTLRITTGSNDKWIQFQFTADKTGNDTIFASLVFKIPTDTVASLRELYNLEYIIYVR